MSYSNWFAGSVLPGVRSWLDRIMRWILLEEAGDHRGIKIAAINGLRLQQVPEASSSFLCRQGLTE
jgi:hypothetical protein